MNPLESTRPVFKNLIKKNWGKKCNIELTRCVPVYRRGRCRRHRSGNAVQCLTAAVLECRTITGCRGCRQPLASAAPRATRYYRYFVEFVTTVVMKQSGCTRTRCTANGTTTPVTLVSTPTVSSTPAVTAPKRLHQPLGARRHSTKVIQPFGSTLLRLLPLLLHNPSSSFIFYFLFIFLTAPLSSLLRNPYSTFVLFFIFYFLKLRPNPHCFALSSADSFQVSNVTTSPNPYSTEIIARFFIEST